MTHYVSVSQENKNFDSKTKYKAISFKQDKDTR